MFKIYCDITKSHTTKGGTTLEIEWVASDPTIDRDSERFSEDAVAKMAASVNNGNIPIKVEHENKFYSEIGVWKEAKIVDNKMVVKGELDLNLSFAKDVETLLKKGMQIGLSVGGKVIDATMEYVKEIGRTVKTYTDVMLSEISIVKNPSNYNADGLAIAKSFDVTTKRETTNAQKMVEMYKTMQKVSPEELYAKELSTETRNELSDKDFAYVVHNKDGSKVRKLPIKDATHVSAAAAALNGARGGVDLPEWARASAWAKIRRKAKALGMEAENLKPKSTLPDSAIETFRKPGRKWKQVEKAQRIYNEAMSMMGELIKSTQDDEITKCVPCEPCETSNGPEVEKGIGQEDIEVITAVFNILQNIDINHIKPPKETTDKDSREFLRTLPDESFVVWDNMAWRRLFPHHNKDFSLNMEWLQYAIAELLTGSYSWLSPSDYSECLLHLYHHYKLAMLTPSTTTKEATTEVAKEQVETKVETPVVEWPSDAETALMKSCYDFRVLKMGERPQWDGNDLSDKEVTKVAEAYKVMMERKRSAKTLGTQFSNWYRNGISESQPLTKEEAPAAKVEAPAEEITKSKKEEPKKDEEKKDEDKKEETKKEVTDDAVSASDKKEEKKDEKKVKKETDEEHEVAEDVVEETEKAKSPAKDDTKEEAAEAKEEDKEAADKLKEEKKAPVHKSTEEVDGEKTEDVEAPIEDAQKSAEEIEKSAVCAKCGGMMKSGVCKECGGTKAVEKAKTVAQDEDEKDVEAENKKRKDLEAKTEKAEESAPKTMLVCKACDSVMKDGACECCGCRLAKSVTVEDMIDKTDVTPGKKMSDHNAKRQARESLTGKDPVIKTEDAERALDEKVGDWREKAISKHVDTALKAFHGEHVKPLMDSHKELTGSVEKCMKSVEKLHDKFDAMGENMKKSFSDEVSPQVELIQKAYEDQQVQLTATVNLLNEIAKTAQPRKSVANFVALEKSAQSDLSEEQQICKLMDSGMTLSAAMTVVKTASANQ